MNKIITGKIKKIYKTYALVETRLGVGICHISNFSDYKINDLEYFIELYQPSKFLVLSAKTEKDGLKLDLSFKACNPIFCFPEHKLCHCSSGFAKLRKYVHHLAYLETKKLNDCNKEQ